MLSVVAAEKILTDEKIPFQIVKTSPCSNKFQLLEDCQYVLRQKVEDGVYYLVVGAKMGKEVQ